MQKFLFNSTVRSLKLPAQARMRTWLTHALGRTLKEVELHIDFVGKAKMRKLNAEYRKKDYATNILSFSNTLPLPGKQQFLGNLILCPEVIQQEAKRQEKTFNHHLAHLLIHGCLHLLGFDHEKPSEAKKMEALEVKLLKQLGIANPYE